MADSYDSRIEAAISARDQAVQARDRLYPGSREWESANGKVEEWDATLRELRRAAGS